MRGSTAARIGIEIGAAFSSGFKNVFGQANTEVNRIGNSIKQLEGRQRDLNKVIKEQERLGAKGSPLKVMYAQQEIDQITNKIGRLRQEHERLIATQAKAHNVAQRRQEVGGQLVGAAATAVSIGLPVVGAISKASEFEYQLQLIANTANMTRAQTIALGDAIKENSRLTGNSAEEMQKAMGFLVAAGMDVGTAQASLLQIGRTAKASGADIEDLSKAAFVLQDALKIAPGQAMQDALDTLAQAGKEGNVELRDMAKQLPVLGSGFVALKMDGREAAATMAAALQIARKGAADADEAANNMKNFIAKVLSPETLKKAQKEFGLDLYKVITDAQTSGGNPFEASIREIMRVTGGDQKKIGDLFQDMQVQNFIRPMIQNFQEYERIKQVALSAKGVTDADFAKTMATSKMRTAEFTNEVGRLAIAIGGPLSVALGTALGMLTPVVQAVTQFANENPVLTASIIGVVGGLAVLRVAMLGVQFGWLLLQPALTMAVGVFGKLAVAARLFGTAIMWLGRAMLANPIGIALGLLATAGYLLWRNWDGVKAGLVAIWETIKQAGIAAFEALKAAVGGVIDWLAEKTAWVFRTVDAVKAAANSVGDKIGGVWQGAKQFVGVGDDTAGAAPGAPAAAAVAVPAARGGGPVTQTNTFNAPITINGATDPAATAKTVRAELDKREREQAATRRALMADKLGY
jgi:TP901 family phage tail tape measure protein